MHYIDVRISMHFLSYWIVLYQWLCKLQTVNGNGINNWYFIGMLSMMALQISGNWTVNSTDSSDLYRKYWSSFLTVIHQWPMDSPHKGPVMRETFRYHNVSYRGLMGNIWVLDTYCHFISNSWELVRQRSRGIYFSFRPMLKKTKFATSCLLESERYRGGRTGY